MSSRSSDHEAYCFMSLSICPTLCLSVCHVCLYVYLQVLILLVTSVEIQCSHLVYVLPRSILFIGHECLTVCDLDPVSIDDLEKCNVFHKNILFILVTIV